MRRARYVYCPFAYNQNHLSTGGFTIRPYFCSQEASCRRLPVPCNRIALTCGGKLPDRHACFHATRFTPTRVGKTATTPVISVILAGSPPRGWGKLMHLVVRRRDERFTPTRVGKTRRAGQLLSHRPVHPHACGENVDGFLLLLRFVRFTPTRVGKTSAETAATAVFTVHPHACGENRRRGHQSPSTGGSPPRVWGKHFFYNRFAFRSHF